MAWMIYLMLGTAFVLVAATSLSRMVRVLSLQSACLALLGFWTAYRSGIGEIYIAASLTFVVKALLIPWILLYTVRRLGVKEQVEFNFGIKKSLLLSLGFVLLSFEVLPPNILHKEIFSGSSLPVAISLVLIGLFIMIARKKALTQIVGLLVMENGLYMLAMSATMGMPLLVEIGIFLDLVVGALVMGILTFRINQSFDSIDTSRLRNLRG
ncbi:MAG: NADH-quinone oxidoreductase subunit K [Bacillota bacterium]|jgi:hydrogenase-4 membrane subunit HyfE|nr:hydrogenase, rane subunit 2-like protein [Peptococcaceae bacterium]